MILVYNNNEWNQNYESNGQMMMNESMNQIRKYESDLEQELYNKVKTRRQYLTHEQNA